jgi:ribosomal-protein-alanine N-acetyltransferase
LKRIEVKLFLNRCPPESRDLEETLVQKMDMEDLEEVLSIERSSSVTPWSKKMFVEEILSPTSHCFTLKVKGGTGEQVAGYICFREILGESELLNLSIHPHFRRMGFGKQLMAFYLDFSVRMGIRACYLEVSVSNEPAIRLYDLFSYHAVGRRKRFYQGKVDALLMMRAFS